MAASKEEIYNITGHNIIISPVKTRVFDKCKKTGSPAYIVD